MPRHVAIIMDGNRRWARERHLPAAEGHRRGIASLREATRFCKDWGIPILTVYGFSTENWKRDPREISLLMELCVFFARHELAELQRNGVRVNVIGDYRALPTACVEALDELMARTAANGDVVLNLAVNYSARAELLHAARALARDVRSGKQDPETIDDSTLASYLFTADFPDPDLLIRPGGEMRLSNFLLYQVAYTELWVTPTYWPAFTAETFAQAIVEFQGRQRRFGGT
ncbi:MAG TPA: polyprenyl diphosphate synthase [Candidatus Dormibacteraeota bacterium]|nr:polyprenyl diphosphate synthase [Candidatus Dormibacteraeota bacterium]